MRVVILGTGTDVGKTFVTARLAAALATSRRRVLALKPIESGVADGENGDAGRIAAAAGHEPGLSPWRFSRPVSPHLAAHELGHTIRLTDVLDWVGEQEQARRPDVTLIESAGGVLSPLGPGLTNLALAEALGPASWLVVAPDSLGVLHDLSATLRVLPRVPEAVVLSCARPADASTGSNARELQRLGISEIAAVFGPNAGDAGALVARLFPSQA
jgi:dethiobiotin synthetase